MLPEAPPNGRDLALLTGELKRTPPGQSMLLAPTEEHAESAVYPSEIAVSRSRKLANVEIPHERDIGRGECVQAVVKNATASGESDDRPPLRAKTCS